MAETWNVRETPEGVPITWKGKPLRYRINWSGLNSDRRFRINQALEAVAPKVGSGCLNNGQTSLTPANGEEVAGYTGTAGESNIYVRAISFTEVGAPPGAVGHCDVWWQQGEYKGAVIFFNTDMYGDAYWGQLEHFKAVAYHEAGHAVGLQHVSSINQVMYGTWPHDAPYQPGDLQGLAVLKAAR